MLLDHLSDSAKQHFHTYLRNLDAFGVRYVMNPRMPADGARVFADNLVKISNLAA